jgi:hypothetical protein
MARLRRLSSLFTALALVVGGLIGLVGAGPASAAEDSAGADFWLTFPTNYNDTPELTLFVTGPTATSGTVSIAALGFSAPFSVTPGTVTSVPLPPEAQLSEHDGVQAGLGVHVTAGAEVTVYGLNRIVFTTDAYLGLPTDILGTSYRAISYTSLGGSYGGEIGVVATQPSTTVTITPKVDLLGHPAGTPFSVSMNQGDAYQLNDDAADTTGTLITADKPIAVFGGHKCVNIPPGYGYCDHLVEQLPPTSAWGKNFVSMPLATRLGGDTFRILAAEAGTDVTINGSLAVGGLGAGDYYEQIIDGPARISATKPILVAQYSNGSSFDGVTSDPFMMLIPPYEQFLAAYTISTPATGFAANFVNVVAPAAAVGSITLDGVAIPSGSFTPIGASGFSGVQVPIGLGSHSLAGPLPFGVHSYGFDAYDSYGYPGGMSLSAVATVNSLTLSPKTDTKTVGDSACVTGTVEDSTGAKVSGIRVDFSVTGANPGSGFAFSDALGEATFCYTGTSAGGDSIVGSVGTITDTAAKTWNPGGGGTNEPPSASAGGPYSGVEGSPIAISGSASDPDGDPLTKTWSVTPGAGTDPGATCTVASPSSLATSVTCNDDGTFNLALTVNDGHHSNVVSSTTISVANANPVVDITSPADMAAFGVGANVNLSASVSDPGSNDTIASCQIDWGDGTTTSGTTGSGSCTGSHAYGSIGVFTVTVTVTDDDGGIGSDSISVVVSEAAAKITGGGFFNTGGRTSFGFVASPSGSGFKGQILVQGPGKKMFKGNTVQSLSVSGRTGTWSGTGKWNGQAGYTFSATATDNGRGNTDTFSVTIRDASNSVVFSASGTLRAGNIVVHA